MADYVLNAFIWNMGYDEANDLATKIADILAERGYGLKGDEDDPMRSIVALCPIDFTDEDGEDMSPEAIFDVVSAGSRLLIVPQAAKDGEHEIHRAVEDE